MLWQSSCLGVESPNGHARPSLRYDRLSKWFRIGLSALASLLPRLCVEFLRPSVAFGGRVRASSISHAPGCYLVCFQSTIRLDSNGAQSLCRKCLRSLENATLPHGMMRPHALRTRHAACGHRQSVRLFTAFTTSEGGVRREGCR